MWKPALWFALFIVLIAALCGISVAQQFPSSAPAVIAAVAPKWPPLGYGIKRAEEKSSSETADIEVTIDEKGNVTSAKIIKAHPLIALASLTAAKQWRFAPGESGRVAQLKFVFVVFDRGMPDAQVGPIFHPPYEVESRTELPHIPEMPFLGRHH
jgi:hypothetical protein